MAPRLLVLEDDDGIRAALRMAMEDAGFDVLEHADAESALERVRDVDVDLMLVDLMLGGMDGFSFIKRVRPQSQAPIIVLSARDGTQDIVTALESGADDYVTKPFVVEELVARMRAMLRRPPLAGDSTESDQDDRVVLVAGDEPMVLDLAAGQLRLGNEHLHLTTTEYRLLSVFAMNAGRVLSRAVLLEQVWDRGFFGDERIVDVHVRRLRTKVERRPSSPAMIVTVRGLGYRLDPQ